MPTTYPDPPALQCDVCLEEKPEDRFNTNPGPEGAPVVCDECNSPSRAQELGLRR